MRAPYHSPRVMAADVVEATWCAAWSALRYDPATQVDDTAGYLRVITPSSSDLLLNAILRFHQERPVSHADVAAAIAPFRAAHRPLQWWLRPDNEPAGLRHHLTQIGMQPWSTVPGMTLALDTWQPQPGGDDISARAASNRAEAEAALAVICNVYSIIPGPMRHWCVDNPHFTMYLATIGHIPAAALACQIHHGVVGFFHVATLPRWRRLGVAQALMTRALADARDVGAHTAALTATPMGEALYRGMGFIPTAPIEMWMPGTNFMTYL